MRIFDSRYNFETDQFEQ
jgi:hypothetical protein